MSSDKMRMRVRIHRLQDIYKSLGKEPNAKGNLIFRQSHI